jgi:hypothetical protein
VEPDGMLTAIGHQVEQANPARGDYPQPLAVLALLEDPAIRSDAMDSRSRRNVGNLGLVEPRNEGTLL